MKTTMKYNTITEIVKGAHNDVQHFNKAPPKISPLHCDGVQLTNAKFHMVLISISSDIKCLTIQLKCTFETKLKMISVSYRATHQHGHTNFWYAS